MACYQINLDEDVVNGLLTRDDALAELVRQVVQQVLVAQVTEHIGAQRYERTEERKGYRNGSYKKGLTTRVGRVELDVPQVRDGSFSTDIFARYQRSEQALVLALMEMVVNGVSTRKVARVTKELCGAEFSKSTVSALCGQLDPIVQEWNNRRLEAAYPFVIVDALYLKVRDGGRVRSKSAMIAIGVNGDGFREVLGLRLGDSENEANWSEFFTWLKDRGLFGVDLVVSDDHRGLVGAVRKCFQGASWQRCQAHCVSRCTTAWSCAS